MSQEVPSVEFSEHKNKCIDSSSLTLKTLRDKKNECSDHLSFCFFPEKSPVSVCSN